LVRRVILPAIILLFIFATGLRAEELSEPIVEIKDGSIYVSSSLGLSEQGLEDLKNGISKEITFYIDLFRVWPNWPDEFIFGKVITRTLRCDSVKGEFRATSLEGDTLIEKRFKSCDSLRRWALSIPSFKLSSTTELEPNERYFVRVTAESRLRRLPPVIGYMLFFIREREFNISRDSVKFSPGGQR